MNPAINPELGVLLHAIGGLAAASFYIPFKRISGWSWEVYWLAAGVASWLIAPTVGAYLTVSNPYAILASAPASSLWWAFFFGALWGIGGLTFGLSMRYLGMSLGYALALGACAAFGTLIPALFDGKLPGMFQSTSAKSKGLPISIRSMAALPSPASSHSMPFSSRRPRMKSRTNRESSTISARIISSGSPHHAASAASSRIGSSRSGSSMTSSESFSL